jgi:hypothetical protein
MPFNLRKVSVDLKHHGIFPVAEDIALRGINHVIFLKVFHCMKLDTVKSEFLTPPEGYRGMLLNSEQLSPYAKLSEYELPQAFVDEACAKGDQCYGLFEGDILAAYQWYTTKATDSGWRGIIVNFNDHYVYMYKAFTHPDHRGRRLYPISVTAMLAASLLRGYKGLLCLVESNNFASLKSCYRMGFTDCGRLYAASVSDRFLFHGDSASREFGFRLTRND